MARSVIPGTVIDLTDTDVDVKESIDVDEHARRAEQLARVAQETARLEDEARLERLRKKKLARRAQQQSQAESPPSSAAASHYPTPPAVSPHSSHGQSPHAGPSSGDSRKRQSSGSFLGQSSSTPKRHRSNDNRTPPQAGPSRQASIYSATRNSTTTSSKRTYKNTMDTAILISSDEDEDGSAASPRKRHRPNPTSQLSHHLPTTYLFPPCRRQSPISMARLSILDDDPRPSVESEPDSDWENYHAGFTAPSIEEYTDHSAYRGSIADTDSGIGNLALRLETLRIEFTTQNAPQRLVKNCVKHADRLYPALIPPPPHGTTVLQTVHVDPKSIPWPKWKAKHRPSYRSCQTRHAPPRGRGSGFDDDYGEGVLELVRSYRDASGAVNVVSQSGPLVAVASSALGGAPEVASLRDVLSCNHSGGLLLWSQANESQAHTVWAHYQDNQEVTYRDAESREQSIKTRLHYTVNDVKFDPANSGIFTSSSKDCTIQSWKMNPKGEIENLTDETATYGISYAYPNKVEPFYLDYKPGGSMLAVGCSNGSTYLHIPGVSKPERLPLKHDNLAVFQVWAPSNAFSRNSDMLYNGGQALDGHSTRGNARAWQLRADGAHHLYDFAGATAELSCESIAVNPTGSCLALFCCGYNNDSSRHTVQLFDIRCNPARSICGQGLTPFNIRPVGADPLGSRSSVLHPQACTSTRSQLRSPHITKPGSAPRSSFILPPRGSQMTNMSMGESQDDPPPPGEVVVSAFSPDGIYLACARNDNVTHVWDSRFMGRRAPMSHVLQHGPSKASAVYGDHNNGITAMTWICHGAGSSAPPLLATGGDDGMIRLWDMRKHRDQDGEILAELETNVGHFTLGDVHRGEMPLVAGDCHAKLYIYDYHGRWERRAR